MEDSEIKICDYVDINYFTNLKEINSTIIDSMQLLSSVVESYEELDEDIDEIQYNSLNVAISNIFDDLLEEETNIFKTLAD